METHGNPELSLEIGKCNDYPEREYTQASGSGLLYVISIDDDIVCSHGKL